MNDWSKPFYQFRLNSACQIGTALEDIRLSNLLKGDDDDEDGLLVTELAIACEIIEQVETAISNNPGLITDPVLDSLVALSEGAATQPGLSQTLAKRALRSLASLNFYMPVGNTKIISRLETLAMSTAAEELAIEAVKLLYVTAPAGASRTLSLTALHRIAKNNENCFVRIEARNILIALNKEINPAPAPLSPN